MDPNELVTITNRKNKQIKQVKRAELPQYGLPTDYNSPSDNFAKSIREGTGGITKVTDIPSDYQSGAAFALNNQKFAPTDQEKKDISDTAKGVLDVLNKRKDYKSDQDYNDALNYAASEYNTRGFAKGGKNLTGTEKTILSGTLINQGEQNANLAQWLTGKVTGYTPPKRGIVADDEQTLRNKMIAALQAAGEDPGKYKTQINQAISNAKDEPSGFGGLVSNAAQDAKNIGNNILNLPKEFIQEQMANPSQLPIATAAGMALRGLPNIVSNLNEDVGRPLEGGDILGRMGQNAYKRPVGTALDVLPLIGAVKGLTAGDEIGAVKGMAGEGGAASNLLPDIGGKLGGGLRRNVDNIQLPPSVYGAAKEAQVADTLDKLGINGSAAQKYAQLEPNIAKLGDQIEQQLLKEPKHINVSLIDDDFMKNLDDQLTTKNLNAKSAKKEISGYLQDLYGNKLSDTISTYDLFKLKQKINRDYQGIAKKMERGTALNDREKVVSAARQTVDDIIANEHPAIKQATVMQSNLYDAAESLAKSRNKQTNIRLPFGVRVPLPDELIQKGEDYVGRKLQGR